MADMSVLGTAPVAAWCPSLDTAGNGTTTLTDLSGNGYNGTLTNMDAATDWVADTDNGGVRALDFDGVNDYVLAPVVWTNPTEITVAGWFKMAAVSSTEQRLFSANDSSGTTTPYVSLRMNSGGTAGLLGTLVLDGADGSLQTTTIGTVTDWFHVVVTAVEGAYRKLWVNGALITTDASFGTFAGSNGVGVFLGTNRLSTGHFAAARIDDIRIFDQALDASDIAYLYASGNGRGVQPAVVSTHPFHPLQRGSTHPLRYT